jgi:hypothetical protein
MYLGFRLVARPLMLAVTLSVGAVFLVNVEQAQAVVGPSASAPYTLGTFKGTAPSGLTSPDDIAVSADGTSLWVGYGNGAATDGSGTKTSSVVEYSIATGTVLQNITEPVPGHIDGLKIDPATGEVWTNIDEDANPKVVIINPKNGKAATFNVSSSLITGGLDDLVFSGNDSAFVTASSQTPSTTLPVIVEISVKEKKKKGSLSITSVLPQSPATVWNVVTNKAETGDMIGDPDSMTIDPAGELVLDNRSDDSLYIVRNPSATNPVLRVPLALVTTPDVPVEVDDTIFTYSLTSGASSTAGTIFITDTTANVIYTLTKPYFPSSEVYSAANVLGEVGLVDLNTGLFAPVAFGFMGVHGLAFSPTSVAIP